MDGSPQTIIAPALFVEFFQAPDEYYSNFGRLSSRLLRFLSFAVAVLLPGVYVSFDGPHKQDIPKEMYKWLITKDELLPTLWEVVVLSVVLRILLDASFRVPKGVLILVSLLRSILLGQTAIAAKLIHPVSLIMVGISFIASLVLGNKGMSAAINVLRIWFIVIAYNFGLNGIIVGLTGVVLYIASQKSIGVPYLSPLLPLRTNELKDVLYRGDLKKLANSKHTYREDN